MKNRQQGLETVELAIAGAVAVLLLFVLMEVGRILYVWNTLTEATRRGARLATVVCQKDASIKDVALFGTPGTNTAQSPVVPGLTRSNVAVVYGDYANGQPTTVTVSITGYQQSLLIPPLFPGIPTTITAPTFATTLPVESLGGSACSP